MSEQNPQPKVFLSYAKEDRDTAIKIAVALQARDINVWYDLSVPVGESLRASIARLISASDYIVVLISPNTMKSVEVRHELGYAFHKEFTTRGVTILPVLIADTQTPTFFQEYTLIDFRGSIEQGIKWLVPRLSIAPYIDFSRLTWAEFENLVADLLVKLNFKNIKRSAEHEEFGYDLKADYLRYDPFGLSIKETWLVQCKFYQRSRVDLKAISELISYLYLEQDAHGLLVTNSVPTSAAQEHLTNLKSKTGKDIRVLDGTELKRLLIMHKDLAEKYFPEDEAKDNESSE